MTAVLILLAALAAEPAARDLPSKKLEPHGNEAYARHLAELKEKVPSFKTLCSTNDHQFYMKDKGTNYAQARYLCYYLQENKLLAKFYRAFQANLKDDPTGYETLKTILGRKDMDEFQREWEAYVMKLRFP